MPFWLCKGWFWILCLFICGQHCDFSVVIMYRIIYRSTEGRADRNVRLHSVNTGGVALKGMAKWVVFFTLSIHFHGHLWPLLPPTPIAFSGLQEDLWVFSLSIQCPEGGQGRANAAQLSLKHQCSMYVLRDAGLFPLAFRLVLKYPDAVNVGQSWPSISSSV